MTFEPDSADPNAVSSGDRRTFLGVATYVAMGGGLVGGYGAFAGIAGRYLYPSKPQARSWLYVSRADAIDPAGAIEYRTPSGSKITIVRRGDSGAAEDFIALSSVCPHLGCQVHWESQNNRFFCPCHNGAFDSSGTATEGPPAKSGQSLPRFALKIESGLLYIEVPVDSNGSNGSR